MTSSGPRWRIRKAHSANAEPWQVLSRSASGFRVSGFLEFGSAPRRRRRGWSTHRLWPWWAVDWVDVVVYWLVVLVMAAFGLGGLALCIVALVGR